MRSGGFRDLFKALRLLNLTPPDADPRASCGPLSPSALHAPARLALAWGSPAHSSFEVGVRSAQGSGSRGPAGRLTVVQTSLQRAHGTPAPPSRGSRCVSAASPAPCPRVPTRSARGSPWWGPRNSGARRPLSAALVWPARRPPFLSLCCRRVVVVAKWSLFPAVRCTCSRRGRTSNTSFSLINTLHCALVSLFVTECVGVSLVNSTV